MENMKIWCNILVIIDPLSLLTLVLPEIFDRVGDSGSSSIILDMAEVMLAGYLDIVEVTPAGNLFSGAVRFN